MRQFFYFRNYVYNRYVICLLALLHKKAGTMFRDFIQLNMSLKYAAAFGLDVDLQAAG